MPRPVVAFVFSRVGPIEDWGGAEELADAPEAIEILVDLWQEARCAGSEDFAAVAEDFAQGTGAAIEAKA